MTQQHRIIPSRVGIEFLEGQLFMAKVFECPVGQLITAALMITGNNTICFQVVFSPSFSQQSINGLALTDVRDNDGVGTASRQIKLVSVIHQTAVNRPPEAIPGFALTSELDILPIVHFPGTIPDPFFIGDPLRQGLDILIQLAAIPFRAECSSVSEGIGPG